MRATLAILLALLLAIPVVAAPPAKLKAGDTVVVRVAGIKDYDGEYVVMTDGAVAGVGFGRVVVGGLTLDQTRALIVKQMRRVLRDPDVSVFVKEQRPEKVYVSTPGLAGAGTGGALDFLPGMDLRQVVASTPTPEEPDLFEVHLFRPGATPRVTPLVELLDGRANQGNLKLEPNDVVAILMRPTVRVWVAGAVAKPGEYLLPAGADAAQAVAKAGGVTEAAQKDPETAVTVRPPGSLAGRGEPAGDKPLRAGDTVLVSLPEMMRVTVSGEVREPGEFIVRGNTTVAGAIARAMGLSEQGTLERVLVMRAGQAIVVDATPEAPEFALEPGDLVAVRRNDRIVLVLGDARDPGPVRLQDGRKYRLADVVAAAKGATDRGSLVRVYLGRPGPDGKLAVREVRLDRFLKDGTIEDNPEVWPGDVVMVGQPRGVNFSSLTQALSGALLLDTLLRR